eukprot:1640672-Amphidinium_carterae.2
MQQQDLPHCNRMHGDSTIRGEVDLGQRHRQPASVVLETELNAFKLAQFPTPRLLGPKSMIDCAMMSKRGKYLCERQELWFGPDRGYHLLLHSQPQ